MIQRRAFLLATAAALTVPVVSAWGEPLVKGRSTRVRLTGARAPIDIVEDELGVPHVRAGSLHDAYFGQGYLVARDRLFQIDIDHRRDMGRMAEAFGDAFVAADKAARLFHYRGDIDAEFATLPPGVLECAQGYVAGINAPTDRRMGHAGTVDVFGEGNVTAKIEALDTAGAIIAPSAADMGTTMRKALGGR